MVLRLPAAHESYVGTSGPLVTPIGHHVAVGRAADERGVAIGGEALKVLPPPLAERRHRDPADRATANQRIRGLYPTDAAVLRLATELA